MASYDEDEDDDYAAIKSGRLNPQTLIPPAAVAAPIQSFQTPAQSAAPTAPVAQPVAQAQPEPEQPTSEESQAPAPVAPQVTPPVSETEREPSPASANDANSEPATAPAAPQTELEMYRQFQKDEAGKLKYLKSQGVQTQVLPTGAEVPATDKDGNQLYKPAVLNPLTTLEDGRAYSVHRDQYGNEKYRDILNEGTDGHDYHTDAATGEQFVNLDGQKQVIGHDPLVPRINQAHAQALDANNQVDDANLTIAKAEHGVQGGTPMQAASLSDLRDQSNSLLTDLKPLQQQLRDLSAFTPDDGTATAADVAEKRQLQEQVNFKQQQQGKLQNEIDARDSVISDAQQRRDGGSQDRLNAAMQVQMYRRVRQLGGLDSVQTDLETIANGGGISLDRANQLTNVGLLNNEGQPDGTSTLKVTSAAIPLLTDDTQKGIAKDPTSYTVSGQPSPGHVAAASDAVAPLLGGKNADGSPMAPQDTSPKNYTVADDGTPQFTPGNLSAGLMEAAKNGLVDQAKVKDLLPQAVAADKAIAEQQRIKAENPAAWKAFVSGAAKGSAFLAGSAPGAALGSEIGGGIGALGGPFAEVTVPLGIAVGSFAGGYIGGSLASKALEATVGQLGKLSQTVQSFQDASQLHPNYDTAGNIVGFAAGLPKSVMQGAGKLIGGGAGDAAGTVSQQLNEGLSAAKAAEAAGVASDASTSINLQAALKAAFKPANLRQAVAQGTAQGGEGLASTVENFAREAQLRAANGETAASIAKGIGLTLAKGSAGMVAIDTVLKEGAKALGFSDQGQTVGGAVQSAIIGAFMSGHGIQFETKNSNQIAAAVLRVKLHQDAGVPFDQPLEPQHMPEGFDIAQAAQMRQPLTPKDMILAGAFEDAVRQKFSGGTRPSQDDAVAMAKGATGTEVYKGGRRVLTNVKLGDEPESSAPPSTSPETPVGSNPTTPSLPQGDGGQAPAPTRTGAANTGGASTPSEEKADPSGTPATTDPQWQAIADRVKSGATTQTDGEAPTIAFQALRRIQAKGGEVTPQTAADVHTAVKQIMSDPTADKQTALRQLVEQRTDGQAAESPDGTPGSLPLDRTANPGTSPSSPTATSGIPTAGEPTKEPVVPVEEEKGPSGGDVSTSSKIANAVKASSGQGEEKLRASLSGIGDVKTVHYDRSSPVPTFVDSPRGDFNDNATALLIHSKDGTEHVISTKHTDAQMRRSDVLGKESSSGPIVDNKNLSDFSPARVVRSGEGWKIAEDSTHPNNTSSLPAGGQHDVAEFETSKGSTYTLDDRGHTNRTKNSPGAEQGETHGAMPAVFVKPADQANLMDEMRGGGRMILGAEKPDGSFEQIRPGSTTDLRGQNVGVYVVSKADGSVRHAAEATTTPAVGLHPVEMLYHDNGAKYLHVGNQITKVVKKGDNQDVQNATAHPETSIQKGGVDSPLPEHPAPAVAGEGAAGQKANPKSPLESSGPSNNQTASLEDRTAASSSPQASTPATFEKTVGAKIDRRTTAFSADSGHLGIARDQMPQVAAQHRGAMANFLRPARVPITREEVAPNTLKPSQSEFNHGKVEKAREVRKQKELMEENPRRILVSSDNHVIDGHHQWLAELKDNPDKPMPILRLGAPARDILRQLAKFPSAGMEKEPDIDEPQVEHETPAIVPEHAETLARTIYKANQGFLRRQGLSSAKFNSKDTGGSGIMYRAGKLEINPALLANHLTNIRDRQKAEGIDSTPEDAFHAALVEEGIHGLQDQIAKQAGFSSLAEHYGDAQLPDDAMPSDWETQGRAVRSDWDQLAKWQRKAEFVRMIVQRQTHGQITEALYQRADTILARLDELAKGPGVSDTLRGYIDGLTRAFAASQQPEKKDEAEGIGSVYKGTFRGKETWLVQQGAVRGFGDHLHDDEQQARADGELTARQHAVSVANQAKRESAELAEGQAKAAREDLGGFTDGMTPLAKGSVVKQLTAMRSYRGQEISRRDLIRKLVSEGRKVETNSEGRVLVAADGAFLGEKTLTKAGLDYANYLIAQKEVSPASDPSETPPMGDRQPTTGGSSEPSQPPANALDPQDNPLPPGEVPDPATAPLSTNNAPVEGRTQEGPNTSSDVAPTSGASKELLDAAREAFDGLFASEAKRLGSGGDLEPAELPPGLMTDAELRAAFPTSEVSRGEATGTLNQVAGVRGGTDGFWSVIPPDPTIEDDEPLTEGPWATREEAQDFIDSEVGSPHVQIVEVRGGKPVSNPFAGPSSLHAAPATLEQAGLPRDRRAQFLDLADKMDAEGINTPEKVAQFLNDLAPDGRARKYSQALWQFIGAADPSKAGVLDWNQVYQQLQEREAVPPQSTDTNPVPTADNTLARTQADPTSSTTPAASPSVEAPQGTADSSPQGAVPLAPERAEPSDVREEGRKEVVPSPAVTTPPEEPQAAPKRGRTVEAVERELNNLLYRIGQDRARGVSNPADKARLTSLNQELNYVRAVAAEDAKASATSPTQPEQFPLLEQPKQPKPREAMRNQLRRMVEKQAGVEGFDDEEVSDALQGPKFFRGATDRLTRMVEQLRKVEAAMLPKPEAAAVAPEPDAMLSAPPNAPESPALSTAGTLDSVQWPNVEVPVTAVAKKNLDEVERQQTELQRRHAEIAEPLKKLAAEVIRTTGSRWERGQIKKSAPAAKVSEYQALKTKADDLLEQFRNLSASSSHDAALVRQAALAERVNNPQGTPLDRLAARRELLTLQGKPVPDSLHDAAEHAAGLEVLRAYPDATPAEMQTVAPRLVATVGAGHDLESSMRLDPELSVSNLRRAELRNVINPKGENWADKTHPVSGLSEELKSRINTVTPDFRGYSVPKDAPVGHLTRQELESLTTDIGTEREQLAARKAEEEAAAEKERVKAADQARKVTTIEGSAAATDAVLNAAREAKLDITKPKVLKAQREYLAEVVKKAIAESDGKGYVQIDVPHDGTFVLLDKASILADFGKRAKAAFTTMGSDAPSMGKVNAGIKSAPAKVSDEKLVQALGEFTHADRHEISHVFSDGSHLLATNGRLIVSVQMKGPGAADNMRVLAPKTGKDVTGKDDAPAAASYTAPLASVRNFLAEKTEGRTAQMPTDDLYRLVNAANAVNSGDKPLRLWMNKDGTLGVTLFDGLEHSSVPKGGENNGYYEGNKDKDAKEFGIVSASMLKDALGLAGRAGESTLKFGVVPKETLTPNLKIEGERTTMILAGVTKPEPHSDQMEALAKSGMPNTPLEQLISREQDHLDSMKARIKTDQSGKEPHLRVDQYQIDKSEERLADLKAKQAATAPSAGATANELRTTTPEQRAATPDEGGLSPVSTRSEPTSSESPTADMYVSWSGTSGQITGGKKATSLEKAGWMKGQITRINEELKSKRAETVNDKGVKWANDNAKTIRANEVRQLLAKRAFLEKSIPKFYDKAGEEIAYDKALKLASAPASAETAAAPVGASSPAPSPTVPPDSAPVAEEKGSSVKQTPAQAESQTPEKSATDDAGAELSYNRRNRVRGGIKWDDIAALNPTLRVKETNKANVYPKPDYPKLIDSGVPTLGAHLVKQVYDSLAAKPVLRTGTVSDDALKQYISGVHRVMDGALKWAKDPAALAAWAQTQVSPRGPVSIISQMGADQAGRRGLLEAVYPGGDWKAHREELMAIGGNKVLGALQPGRDAGTRAAKDVAAGWPAKQEAWQKRGYKIVPSSDAKVSSFQYGDGSSRYQVNLGSRGIKGFGEDKAGAEAYVASLKPTLLVDKTGKIVSQHDSTTEAEESARKLTARDGKTTVSEKGIDVAMARREGPAHRMEGEDVSSSRVQETFGFKGVNFGNWMKGDTNQKERQLHLNHAFDSFMDLADTLDLPPKAMSLNGMIGLAIGAQGGGGNAAAHFVPGVNEINLTRTSGAGSLAHEWAHALDHYFAVQAGQSTAGEPFLSANVGANREFSGIRPEIVDKFQKIVQAMNKREETPEEAKARVAQTLARSEGQAGRWLDSILADFKTAKVPDADMEPLVKRIRALDLGDGKVQVGTSALSPVVDELRSLYKKQTGRTYSIDQVKGLQGNLDHSAYLKSEANQEKLHTPQMVKTDYAKEAAKLDGGKGGKPYYDTNLEKFARAFDAFVSDSLEAKAQKNTYLSHAGRNNETTPLGTERTTITEAFKSLIDTLEHQETDQGVSLHAAPATPAEAATPERIEVARGALGKVADAIRQKLTRLPHSQRIPAAFDSIDTLAGQRSTEVKKSVGADFPDDLDMRAASHVLEAGGDIQTLIDRREMVRAGKDPELSAELDPEFSHAINNADRLHGQLANARNIAGREYTFVTKAGFSVPEKEFYLHHVVDPEQRANLDLGSKTAATDAHRGTTAETRGFMKKATFRTLAEMAAAGVRPASTRLDDLMGRRAYNGRRLVYEQQFHNELAGLKASDDQPLLSEMRESNSKLTSEGNIVSSGRLPGGYDSVQAGDNVLTVHKEYAPLLRALYGTSMVRENPLTNSLLKFAAFAKHGTVGIGDTYHLSRTATNAALGFGVVDYRRSEGLDYTPGDIDRMESEGVLTKEQADYARTNRRTYDVLLRSGFNAGRVADNLMGKLKESSFFNRIPILSPAVSKLNHFIFEEYQRNAARQCAIIAMQRLQKQHPEMSEMEAGAKASREINAFFGNLGNQGVFKSKTMQDVARLFLLAPQFAEGRFTTEARGFAQAGKIPADLLRGKGFKPGNIALAMGGTILSMLVANQVLNMFTKGQPTWDNEEGHKFDAWIPGGPNNRGFYFSPLSIAAEFTHAMGRYLEGGESALDAAAHILGNKLSPGARGVKDLVTGKDYAGRPFGSTGERLKAAAIDAAPSPLPLSGVLEKDPKAALGYGLNHRAGSFERQALSMVGAKVDAAQSARSKMYQLSEPFRENQQAGRTPGAYSTLRQLLESEEYGEAGKELTRLQQAGHDPEHIEAALGYRKDGTIRPEMFSGSHASEQRMLRSFTPEQRRTYVAAQHEHTQIAQRLRRAESLSRRVPAVQS